MSPVLVLLTDLVLDVNDGGVCSKVRVGMIPANTPAHVQCSMGHCLTERCLHCSCWCHMRAESLDLLTVYSV